MKVKTQQEFDATLQQYEETIDPLVQKIAEVCAAQGCGLVLFAVPVELVEEDHTITALRGTARVMGVGEGGSEFLHMINEVASDPEELRDYIAAKRMKSVVDKLCGIFESAAPKQGSSESISFPPGHA